MKKDGQENGEVDMRISCPSYMIEELGRQCPRDILETLVEMIRKRCYAIEITEGELRIRFSGAEPK